jgi:peptidoglycan/xylan/chitin deacetylase (PgdA/CDA1 family)
MSDSSLILEYLADYQPCLRHPARRAIGYCEVCERSLCRECALPRHVCPGPDSLPSPAPRSSWLREGTLALAAIMVCAFAIYGAVHWTVPLSTAPRPAGAGPAAPTVAERSTGGVVVSRTATARQAPTTTQPGEALSPLQSMTPDPQAAIGDPRATRADIATTAPVPSFPLPRGPVRSLDRGPGGRREILLSFDAGGETAGAGEILDILRSRGIRTTFFVTGDFIRRNPGLVRQLVADGHEVGNHTYTHLHLTLWETQRRHVTRPEIGREQLLDELARTAAAFRQMTGREMAPFWRAPYGEFNQEILQWAAEAGWHHVGWTRHLDTLDWVAARESHIYRSADEIARRLLAFPQHDPAAANGAIVLMHLGSARRPGDRISSILPRVLTGYQRMGFEFVTASDMMRGS